MPKIEYDKTTTFRTTHELYNAVLAKCDTYPGGMAFNTYAHLAIEHSLKTPIEDIVPKDTSHLMSVQTITMLRLLQTQVISFLIEHHRWTYNDAYKAVFTCIKKNEMDAVVQIALTQLVDSFDAK